MLNETELKNKLFDFLFELCMSHGGDGQTVYQGSRWKENANLFEIWLNEHHPNFLKRLDGGDNTCFVQDQEGIYFTNHLFSETCDDIIRTERI